MKHPLLAGLAIGIFLALASLLAYRQFSAPTAPPMPLESVDLQAVWATRLPDLSGKTQALQQWQGKVLVVNFWAPWCPPCRKEIPGFVNLQTAHGNAGLQFIGIALDAPDTVRAYVDSAGINYPILLGDAAATSFARAAGNRLGALPYTLILDRRGNPVATLAGGLDEARVEGLIEPLL